MSGIRHLASLAEPDEVVHVQTLAEFLEKANDAPMYLLKDTLVAGGLVIVSGRAKRARKSQLMYEMLLALASGKTIGPFVPVNPEGEHVIIYQQENTVAGNAKQWNWILKGAGMEAPPKLHFLYKYPRLILENEDAINVVLSHIKATGSKLVAFDSLRRCSRGNENDSEASSLISQNLSLIQKMGCTAMFLHHLTKPSKDKNGKPSEQDPDDELRGSGDWSGMYDQHVAIREKLTGTPTLKVTLRDKNDGDKQYDLDWSFDRRNEKTTFKMLSAFDEESLTTAEVELAEVLSFGETITEIRAKEITGLPWDAVHAVIERMVLTGKIVKDGDKLSGGNNG